MEGCCVLAAVGQGMVNTKGVSATMMGALAKANVNIKAIAQVRSGVSVDVCLSCVSTSVCGRVVRHHCGQATYRAYLLRSDKSPWGNERFLIKTMTCTCLDITRQLSGGDIGCFAECVEEI
jgi:hypothetical protein